MQCWLAALQLSLRARGVLAGKASPQPLTNGDRADAEQQTRRGSWTGQLESGKANGVRKEGLEGGYICLDNVCIFFFFLPKQSPHWTLQMVHAFPGLSVQPWLPPRSHPVFLQGKAVRRGSYWEALLCSSSFGEAGEKRTWAESYLGKQLQGCPPGATRHTATSS